MKRFAFILVAIVLSVLPISEIFAQTVWHNPEESGFQVIQGQDFYGQPRGGFYHRLPSAMEGNLRPRVWWLSKQTAGESITFTTDATKLTVRYKVTEALGKDHMPATGVSGIDLYTSDRNGGEVWLAGKFNFKDTVIVYKFAPIDIVDKPKNAQRYTLFLPLYNEVSWLEIGTEEGASFRFEPVLPSKPIVAYGTSICQGASASRPGMAWTNILQRRLGTEVVNMGFSGAAHLETSVIDILAGVDAQAYIIDAMPNSYRMEKEILKDTLIKAVMQLRAARPDVPIILADHLGYPHGKVFKARRDGEARAWEAQKAAYDQLVGEGMKDLYHLTYKQIAMPQDATAEGVHPTDYGMVVYADAYEKILREILDQPVGKLKTTTPVTQQRDPYIWMDRHAHILKEGNGKHFKRVLIGDSIMHFWGGAEDAPAKNGLQVWSEFKGASLNMGCGYDMVENVLWRIYHGQLDNLTADRVFIAIGTNNLGKDADEDILEGVRFIINAVKSRRPEADITLMGLLPRRDREDRVVEINKMYKALAREMKVAYADPGKRLLVKGGKIDETLFTDGLHPNEEGYRRIAPAFR